MTDDTTDDEQQWNRSDDYTWTDEREPGPGERYTPPPPHGKAATIEILTTVAGIVCLLVIATFGILKMAYGWEIPSDIVTILLLFAAGLLGVNTILNDRGGPRTDGGRLTGPGGVARDDGDEEMEGDR